MQYFINYILYSVFNFIYLVKGDTFDIINWLFKAGHTYTTESATTISFAYNQFCCCAKNSKVIISLLCIE